MSTLTNVRELSRLTKIPYGPLNRAITYDRLDKLSPEDQAKVIEAKENELKAMKAKATYLQYCAGELCNQRPNSENCCELCPE